MIMYDVFGGMAYRSDNFGLWDWKERKGKERSWDRGIGGLIGDLHQRAIAIGSTFSYTAFIWDGMDEMIPGPCLPRNCFDHFANIPQFEFQWVSVCTIFCLCYLLYLAWPQVCTLAINHPAIRREDEKRMKKKNCIVSYDKSLIIISVLGVNADELLWIIMITVSWKIK